jgi:hypothetical protein
MGRVLMPIFQIAESFQVSLNDKMKKNKIMQISEIHLIATGLLALLLRFSGGEL